MAQREREGFLFLPDRFNYCGNHLSPSEKETWRAILMSNWDKNPFYRSSWPSKKRLAILVGVSEKTMTKYLKGLINKGILLTMRRFRKTTIYLLLDPPQEWMLETKRRLDQLRERERKRTLVSRLGDLGTVADVSQLRSEEPFIFKK
jgi:hypothetical protein